MMTHPVPLAARMAVALLLIALLVPALTGCGGGVPEAERALTGFTRAMAAAEYEAAYEFGTRQQKKQMALDAFVAAMEEYNDPEDWKSARVLSSRKADGRVEVEWKDAEGGPYTAVLELEDGNYRIAVAGK